MNEQQIKQAAQAAFERTGISKGVVADYLHTVPSNISNWLDTERAFPKERLMELARVLNDFEFTSKVIEFTLGIKLFPETDLQAPMQNDWFLSKKEENERKALEDTEWLANMACDPENWTFEMYQDFLKYSKEMSEEVQAETLYLNKLNQIIDYARRVNNFKVEVQR